MYKSTPNRSSLKEANSHSVLNSDRDFRTRFISDFVSYMRDCAFTVDDAYSYSNIVYALAISYRPLLDFWRKLDTDIVVTALSVYAPLQSFNTHSAYREHAETMQDIGDYLFMNQHDELNAELLAQLPKSNRPDEAGSASDWICEEHERRGDIKNFEYAQADGYKCGRAALAHLARLEAAANGKAVLSIDAKCAQDVRKQAIMPRTSPVGATPDVDHDDLSEIELYSLSSDGVLTKISPETIDFVEHHGTEMVVPKDMTTLFFSEMNEIFDSIAKDLSAELGTPVTKEHVAWAYSTVLRQGHAEDEPSFSEMVNQAVRDAIALNLDIKALLWEKDERDEQ